MELLTNKNFTQKIIIALVFVILFNFVSPQISFGSIGGVLFEPIKDLTLTIADGVVYIIQKIIFGMDASLIKLKYDKDWKATLARSSRRTCRWSNSGSHYYRNWRRRSRSTCSNSSRNKNNRSGSSRRISCNLHIEANVATGFIFTIICN